jgi:transposase
VAPHPHFTPDRAAAARGQGYAADSSDHRRQSMKTVEESAPISGYDSPKNVKGRKRHLLVDSLGLPLSVYVTPADVQDRAGAGCLLAGLKPLVPRLKKIWADGAYSGEGLARWCEERGGWELEVVELNREAKGFKVLPKRCIVERTFRG